MLNCDATKGTLKGYLLDTFLPGEDPEALTDSTVLIEGGILDSISTLKLVAFIEEEFKVEIEPHEASVENFNTIPDIARLIHSKQAE